MAVMAGRSASSVGLISSVDIRGEYFCPAQKKSPGGEPGLRTVSLSWRLVALAEQLQEQREQGDEVQVERECAGDRRTFRDFTALRGIAVVVVVLQPLGIPGGEACEHQH